jgi:hypothetical protein
MSSAIDKLPLREKLRDAAHSVRELVEHLELGFVPKVHELRRLSRQPDPASNLPPVADLTIRSHVSAVLESDRFTAGLNENLEKYLQSIQKNLSEEINRGVGQ